MNDTDSLISDQIILNRLDITGPIDLNTPRCVIEEICVSHRIKFEQEKLEDIGYITNMINTIYNSPTEKINKDYEDSRILLKTICGYVNPNHKGWRKKTLIKAFNFLQSFKNIENFQFKTELPIGVQTNNCPESLNACILYSICKYFKLQITFKTTIDEMYYLIKLMYNIKNNNLIHNMKYSVYESLKFNEFELYTLVNLLFSINPDKIRELSIPEAIENIGERDIYTSQEYDELAIIISNRDIRIRAKSHLEAIIMCAIYHKIDISNIQNPYQEYLEIQKIHYFPLDDILCQRFKETSKHPDSLKNPMLFEVFNPNLPATMYSRSDLYKLADQEGIKYTFDTFSETIYSQLQAYCYINNFYHGKQGIITNKENTFFETLDELKYDEIVVYGSRVPELFIFFTYGELRETFQNYMRFQNPNNLDIFDEISINKLYLLTQKSQKINESDDVFEERIALGEEIERVKLYIQNKNNDVDDFLQKYEIMSQNNKKYVEDVLNMLLDSAMYMRAWNGTGPYPLDSDSTNFEQEEQIIVDDRVTQSLITIEYESHNDIGRSILKLPLIQYHKDSKSFITSTDESEGLTIEDRLYIIKGGEDGSINSCIRMSSNKLCASAYYYMRLIGMIMPFDINDVTYIT